MRLLKTFAVEPLIKRPLPLTAKSGLKRVMVFCEGFIYTEQLKGGIIKCSLERGGFFHKGFNCFESLQ